MPGLLLQSPPPPPPPEPGLWDSFQMPTQPEYVQHLLSMGSLQAFALAACGVVYLIYGWKMFKVLVIANAGTLGALLGHQIGLTLQGTNMPIILAVAGGLLLAALAWPLMKYAISLMGGLAGSLLGFAVWHYISAGLNRPELGQYAWAGALIGLVTLGLLAFVIFRIVVIVFTSFQGALMGVSGVLSLLLKSERFSQDLQNSLTQDVYLLPLLVGVPAVIAFALQQAASGGKAGKKKGDG